MNGRHAACPGHSFPVAVDAKTHREAPATWVRVALLGDAVGTLARGLPRAPRCTVRGAPHPRDVDRPRR